MPSPMPLLDRADELAALERAAMEAAAGEGRVVLIEGGPGAGKTRLLAEAQALSARCGLRLLTARGAEMEREHPYGIVRQLYEAALLGPEPAAWLTGPALAASGVFRPETTVDPAAFATLGGLYWLTVNAAAEAPLALVVDDLHWADRPSLHFLQYLVRRVEGIPALLLLGGRPAQSGLLADIAAAPATSLLHPAPLSEGAAGQLTLALLGVRPADRFADACWRASAGNPLLLVELLRTLRAERVDPDDEHVDVVDHVGPAALARIALVRLRRLGGDALAVAQAIALLDHEAASSLIAELAELDERAVAPAVAALIAAEVLDARPPLGFVHQIVRDAVYQELTPDDRDRRHARAAELLHARAAEPDLIGAHLLLAAPRGERWIAGVLEAAAADAAQRGAVESAVTFLRRALAERPGDADPDLLLRLGLAEAAIDPDAAITHLEAARRAAPEARRRARIGELITRMLVFTDPTAAILAAQEARGELTTDTDDRAAALLALERYAGRFTGAGGASYPAADPTSARGRMLMAVQAWDMSLSGGTAEECVALAAGALLLDEATGTPQVFTQNGLLTALIASTTLMFADDARAQDFWDKWYVEAVRAGRAQAVIAGGIWQSWLQFRVGRLADAEATLRAALEGPRRWGPGTDSASPAALAQLVDVQLGRGDLTAAQATLERVPGRSRPTTEGELMCRCRELRLRCLQGHFDDVLGGLDAVREQLETVVNPVWYPWRSVRAEALAGTGRTEAAIGAATEELALARAWGTPGPIGGALTLLGTLEGRIDRLEDAVATTRHPFARLEHARALLALGSALRRDRRPSDARAHLRDAYEQADRCGATTLARAARDELAAAGGRPRAAVGGGPGSLTPSERRVAELAASGRRNQEIAQQLFLSPKTVEVHLSNSYRKLGIRTRAELTSSLDPAAERPGLGR